MPSYAEDYQKIESAISYIEDNFHKQPELDEIARQVGVSPYYFQRIFKQWAGISPKRFLQYITLEHAKVLIRESKNILETSLDVGLSSPSRLHDLFINCEAVSPGEFKSGGDGLIIKYGMHETPFGNSFIAVSERGLCELDYPKSEQESLDRIKAKWPLAKFIEDRSVTHKCVERIFGFLEGKKNAHERLSLHLKGTNFQIKVWQALLRIPIGNIVSYQDIAEAVGSPKAVRAVGSAVGVNPIAYLIPCHRVLRKSGEIGGYATGTPRKRVMLAMEKLYSENEV